MVSNMPVCSAYRASLFTGKYATTTGMVINELRMNPNHTCIAHLLTRAGYETGYIGKWHLWANQLGRHDDPRNSFVPPGPHRLGFDGFWAAYNFHHHYTNAWYHGDSPERVSYGPGVYEPDGQTDLAIVFLRRAAKTGRPFALFLSYGVPHDPWSDDNVPAEYRALFEDTAFPHPPNYRAEDDPYADAWGRLEPEERERLPVWRRNYHAMTANLDRNVGRLTAALDELDLAEKTVLVFTSDHGEMFGAHGRRAKNIFYEEAVRVPFLLRWPDRIPAGRTAEVCAGTVDIMPTLLGLLRLEVPAEVEGMDLSDTALGRPDAATPSFALLQNTGACADWKDGHEWRGLRTRRYTYARYRVDGAEFLFDNRGDPFQTTNLAGAPECRPQLEECRECLEEKLVSVEDTFEACTWYRDHWTDGNRVITGGARGPFRTGSALKRTS